ncbi:DUF4232 domain-containing protein [Streptomyces sp. NPDC057136]|uniref:DUF4232 domain-containing protein n=1 Tax=Streptomyces sp. NPDC057136 TaxID=3346029 RepID=UPI00363A0355
MRNLHLRRAARTSALGAVALIASLSLTACQGDDEAASGSSASAPAGPSSQTPAESSGASGDKSTATPATDQGKNSAVPSTGSGSDSGSDSGGGTSTAKPQDVDDDAAVLACTGANTKLTMTEVQRPVNHMLLTMTNTGSKACNAYYHPYLRFGDAQSVPKTFDDSKPQAVATINPGESVYTGVMTSAADGSGTNGYSTKDLSVGFQNRDGNSDGTGSAITVPLAKSVFVDSSLSVTYWQTSMDDALTY